MKSKSRYLLAAGVISCVVSSVIVLNDDDSPPPPVRVVFGGDVMLGRSVGKVLESDPESVFREIRFVLTQPDLAVANLESPLTVQTHKTANPHQLEAEPESAAYLNQAGFDLMSIANNHAGDAGRDSISETIDALEKVGIAAIGGGSNSSEANGPVIFERNGLRLAFLAFDVSQSGVKAGDGPGIAHWDEETSLASVREAQTEADVVFVSIHGGTEYQTESDGVTSDVAQTLAFEGVDVVWGHGPHVVHPVEVIDPDNDGRPTVVATSLGNLVFDQNEPETQRGALLEVLVTGSGVVAHRIGSTRCPDRRVRFEEWDSPAGDAVSLDLEWWSLDRVVDGDAEVETPVEIPKDWPEAYEVRASVIGDFNRDGETDLAMSFRREFRRTSVNEIWRESSWTDHRGFSAHLGLYDLGDLRQIWVAGTLLQPIETLKGCGDFLLAGYSELDDPTVNSYAVLEWADFGFFGSREIPGDGTPVCVELNGDGLLSPALIKDE